MARVFNPTTGGHHPEACDDFCVLDRLWRKETKLGAIPAKMLGMARQTSLLGNATEAAEWFLGRFSLPGEEFKRFRSRADDVAVPTT